MSEPSQLPPIKDQPLSVLLIARNCSACLTEVLSNWVDLLQTLGREFEILLVDDGSTDGTQGLADLLAERQPVIRIFRHDLPRGLGASLSTGLAAARLPLFFYTTCDRQYRPQDLLVLLNHIDNVEMVSGFRVFAPVPLWLRCMGWIYRGFARVLFGDLPQGLPGWLGWSGHVRQFLARIFFGVHFQDVDCAFRLFRRSILARIPIQSMGAFAQVEILAKANFLGCLMAEEPVEHHPPANHQASLLFQPRKSTWKEARRLLKSPNFGPAILPADGPPSVASTTEQGPGTWSFSP